MSRAVRLMAALPGGEPEVVARLELNEAGQAYCDQAELLAEWQETGLQPEGEEPVFPEDGARFMEAVLACHQSEFFWAEVEEG